MTPRDVLMSVLRVPKHAHAGHTRRKYGSGTRKICLSIPQMFVIRLVLRITLLHPLFFSFHVYLVRSHPLNKRSV